MEVTKELAPNEKPNPCLDYQHELKISDILKGELFVGGSCIIKMLMHELPIEFEWENQLDEMFSCYVRDLNTGCYLESAKGNKMIIIIDDVSSLDAVEYLYELIQKAQVQHWNRVFEENLHRNYYMSPDEFLSYLKIWLRCERWTDAEFAEEFLLEVLVGVTQSIEDDALEAVNEEFESNGFSAISRIKLMILSDEKYFNQNAFYEMLGRLGLTPRRTVQVGELRSYIQMRLLALKDAKEADINSRIFEILREYCEWVPQGKRKRKK